MGTRSGAVIVDNLVPLCSYLSTSFSEPKKGIDIDTFTTTAL